MDDNTENIVKTAARCPRCGADSLCVCTKVLRYIPFSSIQKYKGQNGKTCYSEADVDTDNDELDYSYSDGKDWYGCSSCGAHWNTVGALAKELSGGNIVIQESVM